MAWSLLHSPALRNSLWCTTARLQVRAMSTEDDVILETVNDKGVITLNRPKALNSLNLSMVQKMLPTLQRWEDNKTLILVKGTGNKAFCAGGDVRSVAEAGLGAYSCDFFRYEYMMNGKIGTYKVPYIAFIDGIVMGGGVGISVHGHYRIATERTLFAMPETQIGLFPDVGGSYFLPRLGGKLGLYLALTGIRLKGADVHKAGIATHYVNSECLPELECALMECSNESDIDKTLRKFSASDNAEFALKKDMDKINTCFSGCTMEEIYTNLDKDGSKWAMDTKGLLCQMSPTSLKVTIKQLEYGSRMNLLDCLQMEYRIVVHCLQNKDFYEGVRALLVDKDKQPRWNPAKVEDVSDAMVDTYFEKLPSENELKHKL